MSQAPEPKTEAQPRVPWPDLVFLALLWLDLFYTLSMEWDINEQYEYGWLVPPIGCYLIYLRSMDCPQAVRPGRPMAWLLGVGVLLVFLLPVRIIEYANPEWRMMYWAHGLIVFATTLLLCVRWGGLHWMRHFSPAIAMFLFAIPWPSGPELQLVQQLMRYVAAFTTEIVNLLGIYAVQKGNIIHMSDASVGVEEACSGLRSLQSTLMTAYFLGEMFRFRPSTRIGLVLIGVPVSVAYNLARTLFLTLSTHYEGSEFMNEWHDFAGNTVAILAFLTMVGLAALVKRWIDAGYQVEEGNGHVEGGHFLPNWQVGALAGALLFTFLCTELWYLSRGETVEERVHVSIDWKQIESREEIEFPEISDSVRAILRYSEGEQANWVSPEGMVYVAYFLRWDAGRISSFAGIHRPDVCMPAAGYKLVDKGEAYSWGKDDLKLKVVPYVFQSQDQLETRLPPVYVFFSVWDRSGEGSAPAMHSDWSRLRAAWDAQRVGARDQILLYIRGPEDISEAKALASEFLEKTMVIDSKA